MQKKFNLGSLTPGSFLRFSFNVGMFTIFITNQRSATGMVGWMPIIYIYFLYRYAYLYVMATLLDYFNAYPLPPWSSWEDLAPGMGDIAPCLEPVFYQSIYRTIYCSVYPVPPAPQWRRLFHLPPPRGLIKSFYADIQHGYIHHTVSYKKFLLKQ